MKLLTVSNVTKTYPSAEGVTEVLRGANLVIDPGETVALEGESGSGKSTALHLIAGLDRPTSGSILLEGQEMADLSDPDLAEIRRTRIGIIFQQFNLIPSLTTAANIAFHARLADRYDKSWTDHLVAQIGLADHLDKYPEALSGGQQQRVAIARTLAARPQLILADEPTGNLDEDTAERVLDLMQTSAGEAGAALLMVTHSPRLAARMARRLTLSHGVIKETKSPDAASTKPAAQ